MSKYEVSKVAEKARELCEQFPDVVYRKANSFMYCHYTIGAAGGGCGCIVGQAIVLAYPELQEELEKIDSLETIPYSTPTLEKIGFDINKYTAEVRLLERIQLHQDRGCAWGESLRRAEVESKDFITD